MWATLALGVAALCLSCSPPDPPQGVGTPAPDMKALTLTGETVAMTSFRGEPVLLNLWATWCAPCRKETPYLQTLHESYADQGLRVVGMSQDMRGSGPAIRAFAEEFGVTYTVLSDPDMIAMDRYSVIGLPTTFLVDRAGTIRQVVIGPLTPENPTFEAALHRVLQ